MSSSLRGDITGGVTAALLGIPLSMGYGVVAVSALGDAFTPHGVIAGLYGAVFAALTAVALGSRVTFVHAPRSVIALLLSALVADVVARRGLDPEQAADPRGPLVLVFLIVLLAGLIQALFGALRLGALVRYIPSPVMAGFQNAAAALIFVGQVDLLLGLDARLRLADIPRHLGAIQPLTLLVGLVTVAAMWYGPRVAPRIAPSVLALVAGNAAYYLLVAAGQRAALGPTIGAIPRGIPTPGYGAEFLALLADGRLAGLLPQLLSGALSLAIVASLDSLLCARTLEGMTGAAGSGSRDLLRLGLGNAVAACFGGVAAGVNLGSSLASHRAGGRTWRAGLVSALTTLAAVLVLSPALEHIPRVVVGGMLVVVALQLVDRWSLGLVRKVLGGALVHRRRMALDLAVVVLVATAAIAVNLVAAVGLGVGVAVVTFLQRMSKSVVRRTYRGDAVHSRRTRDPGAMAALREHGGGTVVFELEGPLFFGTAEDLARRVDEAARDGVGYVVLDLKRVNEIDTTGARIIHQLHDRLARDGRHLLLSHLHPERLPAAVLRDLGVTAALTDQKVFADTDRALEWSEDRILAEHAAGPGASGEMPLDAMDVLAGLDARERQALRGLLDRRAYRRGEVVFREGDAGRELFLIARGSASVKLRLPGQQRENRLATFSPGTVFGELALFDREPRSATIEADDDLVCYVLTEEAVAALRRHHPAIALTLLTNLGRELSRRLRRANRMIYQLES